MAVGATVTALLGRFARCGIMGDVRGRQAVEDITCRLALDLRSRFPLMGIAVEQDEGEMMCVVDEGGTRWGEASTGIADDDDLDQAAVELALLSVTQDVADNMWPDDQTDPWPPCPRHPGHPLQPRLVRGVASWSCSRHEDVAVPIGALTRRF